MSHSEEPAAPGSAAEAGDEANEVEAGNPGVRTGLRTVRAALDSTLRDPWLSVVAVASLLLLGAVWTLVTAAWSLLTAVSPVLGVGSSLVSLFLAVLAVVCVQSAFARYAGARELDADTASFVDALGRVGRHLPALAAYATATTLVLVGAGTAVGVAASLLGLPGVVAAVGPFVVLYGWLVATYYWSSLAVRADRRTLGDVARENWRLVRRSWPAVVTCQAATVLLVVVGTSLFAAGVGSVLSVFVAAVRDAAAPLLAAVGLRGPLATLLGVIAGAFGLPLLGVVFPVSRAAKVRLFHRTRRD